MAARGAVGSKSGPRRATDPRCGCRKSGRECAAAIARQTGDPSLAEEIVSIIEDFPGIHLIALDLSLPERRRRLR